MYDCIKHQEKGTTNIPRDSECPQCKYEREHQNLLTLALREAVEKYHGSGNGRRLLIQLYVNLLTAFEEMVEGKMVRHQIDAEVYEDTGGGEECYHCGKQGYLDKDEACDGSQVTENKVLTDLLSLLNEARKEVK